MGTRRGRVQEEGRHVSKLQWSGTVDGSLEYLHTGPTHSRGVRCELPHMKRSDLMRCPQKDGVCRSERTGSRECGTSDGASYRP